jgi:hypothetical protein
MECTIANAIPADLPVICQLFEEAIAFQKENNFIGWKDFDRVFIENDISNQLLFKLVNDNILLGIFCVCYKDELIWRDKEQGDAIYLHRIISNKKIKTEGLFDEVLAWAVAYAKQHQLKYVRMDTWADNTSLIGYYKRHGFRFVENYTTADTEGLPQQNRNLRVALPEFDV